MPLLLLPRLRFYVGRLYVVLRFGRCPTLHYVVTTLLLTDFDLLYLPRWPGCWCVVVPLADYPSATLPCCCRNVVVGGYHVTLLGVVPFDCRFIYPALTLPAPVTFDGCLVVVLVEHTDVACWRVVGPAFRVTVIATLQLLLLRTIYLTYQRLPTVVDLFVPGCCCALTLLVICCWLLSPVTVTRCCSLAHCTRLFWNTGIARCCGCGYTRVVALPVVTCCWRYGYDLRYVCYRYGCVTLPFTCERSVARLRWTLLYLRFPLRLRYGCYVDLRCLRLCYATVVTLRLFRWFTCWFYGYVDYGCGWLRFGLVTHATHLTPRFTPRLHRHVALRRTPRLRTFIPILPHTVASRVTFVTTVAVTTFTLHTLLRYLWFTVALPAVYTRCTFAVGYNAFGLSARVGWLAVPLVTLLLRGVALLPFI